MAELIKSYVGLFAIKFTEKQFDAICPRYYNYNCPCHHGLKFLLANQNPMLWMMPGGTI